MGGGVKQYWDQRQLELFFQSGSKCGNESAPVCCSSLLHYFHIFCNLACTSAVPERPSTCQAVLGLLALPCLQDQQTGVSQPQSMLAGCWGTAAGSARAPKESYGKEASCCHGGTCCKCCAISAGNHEHFFLKKQWGMQACAFFSEEIMRLAGFRASPPVPHYFFRKKCSFFLKK